MAITLAGGSTSSKAEVETASLAVRITPRPIDITSNGSFRATVASGTEGAGAGAASPIFAFRAGVTSIVRRVTFEFGSLGSAFTAGAALFQLFVARAWTVNDTGGTALTLSTANTNKMRTTQQFSSALDIRYSTTGVLTAGTRTLDTNPIANVQVPVSTATSVIFCPSREILRAHPGEWPVELAASEGLVLEATVPASGTWNWGLTMDWDEVSSYN